MQSLFHATLVEYSLAWLVIRISLIHDFTARELVDKQETLGDSVKDDLKKEGNALGADIGVLWRFAPESPLKPSLGAYPGQDKDRRQLLTFNVGW